MADRENSKLRHVHALRNLGVSYLKICGWMSCLCKETMRMFHSLRRLYDGIKTMINAKKKFRDVIPNLCKKEKCTQN